MLRDLLKPEPPNKKQAPESADPAQNVPSHSVLGPNTRIVGTLKTEGNVTLVDIFEGSITAYGDVNIGRQATLNGDLICHRATIGGLVHGNLIAKAISITGSGRVLGDIRTEKLLTEDGAFIQGTITLEEVLDPEQVIKHKARAESFEHNLLEQPADETS